MNNEKKENPDVSDNQIDNDTTVNTMHNDNTASGETQPEQQSSIEELEETVESKPELTEEEKLKLELEEKDKEIASLKDKMLRVQAQASNDKKRYKSDAERSAFETKKRFLKKVLDIRDNIDRALLSFDTNNEQHNTHVEGISLIAS